MNDQTMKNDPDNRGRLELDEPLRSIWLPVIEEVITVIKQDLAGLSV